MFGIDYRTARYTWTVAVVLLALLVVFKIRETLFVFVVSLFFAYLLWPLFAYLDRRLPGPSRMAALAIIYVALIGLIILAGFEIGSQAIIETDSLAMKLPAILSKVPPPPKTAPQSVQALKQTLIVELQRQIAAHSQEIVSFMPQAAVKILAAVQILLFVALVPILSFFFLKDGAELRELLLTMIPKDSFRRKQLEEIAADLHVLLAQYMRALFLLVGVAFGAYGLFFFVIKMPYAILLAGICCLLEFIPMVGPLTAFLIIIAAAIFSGFYHLPLIIIFLAVFRIFQDYVISPQIMSAEMKMHPLVIILGVLAGAQLAGVLGSFISVPVLAVLRVVYIHLRRRRVVVVEESPLASPPIQSR